MNVIFLGAGRAVPDVEENRYPAWLQEVGANTILERMALSLLKEPGNHLIYCFLEADIQKFRLNEIVSVIDPNQTLISVETGTQGAACTALLAADMVDNDTELMIVSLNEYIEVDLAAAANEFRKRNLDGGTLVFQSVHPRYSFVRLDANQNVIEAAQGRPISQAATIGAFWFRRGSDFVAGVKQMIRKNDHHDDRYFVCPVFNQLILMQRRIGVSWIEPALYHPLKTEAQIHHFEFDWKI